MRHIPPLAWVALLCAGTYALSLAPGLSHLPTYDTALFAIPTLCLAALLLIAASLAFRRANTEFMPNSPTNSALVTSGVFAVTRNPMYLGMVLICLAAALAAGRLPVFAAPILMFAIANWVFIPFEEGKMRRQFGESFDAYCGRVRRWL